MNALQIYLVMQLDMIVIGCVCSTAVFIGLYWHARLSSGGRNAELEVWHDRIYRDRNNECFRNEEYLAAEILHVKELRKQRDSVRKKERCFLWLASALFATSFLLPSTKTAAVMLILPQIANSETIRGEAIELYQLAKDALCETQAP